MPMIRPSGSEEVDAVVEAPELVTRNFLSDCKGQPRAGQEPAGSQQTNGSEPRSAGEIHQGGKTWPSIRSSVGSVNELPFRGFPTRQPALQQQSNRL